MSYSVRSRTPCRAKISRDGFKKKERGGGGDKRLIRKKKRKGSKRMKWLGGLGGYLFSLRLIVPMFLSFIDM